MLKRALGIALICLHVVPLNTFAATSADIDSLIAASQGQSHKTLQAKIQENQQLIGEINELDKQIQTLSKDISINRQDSKRNLYIAGASAVATLAAIKYFGRSAGDEVADAFRIIGGMIAAYGGGTATVVAAGASGFNYLLVQIDESKLPALQATLLELKMKLQKQNEALSK